MQPYARRSDTTREARAFAEALKREMYSMLSSFVLVVIETSGLSVFIDIDKHQQAITCNHQTLSFLFH